jgi:DNA polymerase
MRSRRCRWWNEIRRKLVSRNSSSRSARDRTALTGRNVTIKQVRGEVRELGDGSRLVITVHPSSLLRIEDEKDKALQYGKFVDDLRICAKLLKTLPPRRLLAS